MDKSDFSMQNFLNIQEMIRLFDQKSNVLLIIYSVIVSAYISIIKDTMFVKVLNIDSLLLRFKFTISFILSIAIIVLLVIQIYILIYKILKPREAKHYTDEKRSLFYYKHISEMNKEKFISAMNESSNESLSIEIYEQIYEISKIAKKKQDNYNKLANLMFITFVCLFMFMILNVL